MDDRDLPDADPTIFAFRRNVFVAASAGTGKTYRLTALYVLLTLGMTSMGERDDGVAAPPVSPERIVATTFSRAAAAEIATRVEAALREIARWDGVATLGFQPVLEARAEALGRPLDPKELRQRAEDALGRWPRARIDTLHGVARRIVQRHALAVGLPPGVRVLDEEEAQALGDLAVDDALGAALTEGGDRAEAARAILVSTGGVGPARFRIQRLLDRLDEEGLTPRDLALADHLADARVVAKNVLALARRLAGQGSPAAREPAAGLAAAMARAPEGVLLPRDAAARLVELLALRLPPRAKRSAADDALEELVAGLSGKTKAERAAGLVALLEQAPRLRAREQHLVDLIEDARSRVAAAKRQAGALGFGDLLRFARDTLRDDADVARGAREEIDALLVDEFQDTSRVQRDIVYLLRERPEAALARMEGKAAAPPEAAGLEGHGLFLVGDRKQSIYGFRGADVSVFSRIAAELAGAPAARALALPAEGPLPDEPVADFAALRESRRSGPGILRFVNAYAVRDFAGGAHGAASGPPRAFEIAYGPAEHLVPATPVAPELGPGVVVFAADDGTSPDDAEPIVRESSGAAREAHVAAAYVASVTHGGSPGCAYKDVAVLARRRSTIPLVELALARLDIPYVVAGRALYDAPEVRDVAALLRLHLDPRDRMAMAVVLRGPTVGLSDTALATLSVPGLGLSVPLLGRWPASRQVDPARLGAAERARLETFRARFAELRAAALRLSPAEAIRATITGFDLDRTLAALPRAEARIGNLDRLVSIARRRGGTLAAFVRWLERRMRDDADEAEAAVFSSEDDAVRLTTIHASKGLDFPVVVLVDLNAEPRADAGGLGFLSDGDGRALLTVRHYAPRAGSRALLPLRTATLEAAQAEARAREQAERRRLTYVAITRARRTLALIGSAAPPRPASAMKALVTGLDDAELAETVTRTEARALLAAARRAPPRARVDGVEAAPLAATLAKPASRAGARELTIAASELAIFRGCPRRHRLRNLLGIQEPRGADQLDLFGVAERDDAGVELPPPVAADPTLDPRPLQRAAHRVMARWPPDRTADPELVAAALAREGLAPGDVETRRLALAVASFLRGAYLSEARAAGARVTWDEPFVALVGPPLAAAPPASPAPSAARATLRGRVDLRVEHAGGRVDLVTVLADRPRTDRTTVELPLHAAALAAVQRGAGAARARVGVVQLLAGDAPRWLAGGGIDGALAEAELERIDRELTSVASRFADARRLDRYEGVARASCARLGCGFVAACHGEARGVG